MKRKKILTDDEIHQMKRLKRSDLIFTRLVFIAIILGLFCILWFPYSLYIIMSYTLFLLGYKIWQDYTFRNAPSFKDYKEKYRSL